MRVTINDVAREAGVSISTASKALNGSGSISVSTVRAVSSAAERLGYTPNRAAQMLSRKGKTIGVLIPCDPPEIMGLFGQGIESAAADFGKFGIETKVVTYRRRSGEFFERLGLIGGCDCAVIVPDGQPKTCAEAIGRLKMPVITLQTGIEAPSICRGVSINEKVVGKMAAEYLGIAAKTRKAAIITSDVEMYIHRLNIEGFMSEKGRYGLEVIGIYESFDDMETAARLTKRVFEDCPSAGGIYTTSYVAPAICGALGEMGKTEVAVIGMDVFDKTIKCLEDGSLGAVIYQDQRYQSKKAMEIAVAALGGELQAEDVKITPQLVLRANLECYI